VRLSPCQRSSHHAQRSRPKSVRRGLWSARRSRACAVSVRVSSLSLGMKGPFLRVEAARGARDGNFSAVRCRFYEVTRARRHTRRTDAGTTSLGGPGRSLAKVARSGSLFCCHGREGPGCSAVPKPRRPPPCRWWVPRAGPNAAEVRHSTPKPERPTKHPPSPPAGREWGITWECESPRTLADRRGPGEPQCSGIPIHLNVPTLTRGRYGSQGRRRSG